MVNDITPEDVVRAAEVLEHVSRLFEFSNPEFGEWSAADLRLELPNIKAYSKQSAFRNDIALIVENKVIAGSQVGDAVRTALIDYRIELDE
jgi:phenylalanyl-tRNA synthetase beta subunit